MTAHDIINALQLEPLAIEGGYYRETWRSTAGSAIYYLLTDAADSFSALHRLPTDEVYHFYLGDPVEQWRLHPRGQVERVVLGSAILDGQPCSRSRQRMCGRAHGCAMAGRWRSWARRWRRDSTRAATSRVTAPPCSRRSRRPAT